MQRFNNRDKKPSVGALKKIPCHTCGKYGKWRTENRTEGCLHDGLKAFTTAAEITSSLNQSGMNSSKNSNKDSPGSRKTMSFHMARASFHTQHNEDNPGPFVHDGAEYSAVGIVKLKLYDDLLVVGDIKLDPIPASLDGVTH